MWIRRLKAATRTVPVGPSPQPLLLNQGTIGMTDRPHPLARLLARRKEVVQEISATGALLRHRYSILESVDHQRNRSRRPRNPATRQVAVTHCRLLACCRLNRAPVEP